jgi:hypothetical protein
MKGSCVVTFSVVMRGLVPRISLMGERCLPKRDGRDGAPSALARGDPYKPGYDEWRLWT